MPRRYCSPALSPSQACLSGLVPAVVAIAFPPWWNSQQVFEATASADAAIIRTTAIAAILVVRRNDHDGLTRLRAAGAWLTIDSQAIAACFNDQNKEI
jgi:hypothetical protein